MRGRPGIRRLFRLTLWDRWSTRRDVEEEIRLHVELRTEELVGRGMDPREARREAERLFASAPGTLRRLHGTALGRSRRMGQRERLEAWWRDGRNAARGLIRDPLLTVFVVVTLGLGMGAVLTSFSLVDRMLIRDPEHIRAPDELARIYGTTVRESAGEVTSSWIPYSTYVALREGLSGLRGIGAYRVTPQTVGRGVDARRRRVGETLDGYFQALGSRPLHGRYFAAEETDASVAPVAVVSERYWRDVMGADPAGLGDAIEVEGRPYTVVGVAPAGFAGTEVRHVDLWVTGDRSTASNRQWQVVGRLDGGVSAAAVSSAATAVHARTADALPSWFRWFADARLSVRPTTLGYDGSRPFETTMAGWLAVMAGLILLVALGNVANLLLARLARRQRELAVRVTLGSGRGGILRLLGLEGFMLAAGGGALALVVVAVAEPFLRATLMAGEAPWTLTLADGRLLAALLLLVLLTALGIAAGPALQAAGDRLTSALRSSNPDGGRRGSRLRGGLTVLQAALSVVLLVGAGLFFTSLARVRALDLGVDPGRVLVLVADLPAGSGQGLRHERLTYERLARRVGTLPGVEHAALAIGLPLDGGSFSANVYVPGRDSIPSMPGGGPFASAVGPDYFATVGTRLLAGRTFTDSDTEGSERVLVINVTMARTLWPGEEALGRCVRVGSADAPCARVVGVVTDVHRVGIEDRPALQYYMAPAQQSMFGGASLVVRPTSRSPITSAALRRAVLAEEPGVGLVEIQPMSAALDDELRPLRLGIVSFGFSSLLALVVAALGLYSVMAYMVAWRRHEIGVRTALGASQLRVTRLIIRSGIAMAAMGIALGLGLAFWLARWIEPHLFRTSAGDPVVFTAVAATLLVVALAAGWIPSRRAARISPMEALRQE